ncbi:hypothetical protein [Streptomyces cadmiisoli]|uniref:hypothetical protein n=1 Tax=Streptomyces cadmiisoli TaxID=2184053 RepID=UPI003D75EA99
MKFLWLWLIGWPAFALPVAVASLQGWAPKRVRSRTSPWSIRVRGVALLVIWLGGLTCALLRWSGLDSRGRKFLASVAQGGLLVFAGGLVAGSPLGEWFYRRAVRAQVADQAEGISGRL